jgi:hypothetical protein
MDACPLFADMWRYQILPACGPFRLRALAGTCRAMRDWVTATTHETSWALLEAFLKLPMPRPALGRVLAARPVCLLVQFFDETRLAAPVLAWLGPLVTQLLMDRLAEMIDSCMVGRDTYLPALAALWSPSLDTDARAAIFTVLLTYPNPLTRRWRMPILDVGLLVVATGEAALVERFASTDIIGIYPDCYHAMRNYLDMAAAGVTVIGPSTFLRV